MPWQTLAFFNFNLINFYIYFNHQTHVFFTLKSSMFIFIVFYQVYRYFKSEPLFNFSRIWQAT